VVRQVLREQAGFDPLETIRATRGFKDVEVMLTISPRPLMPVEALPIQSTCISLYAEVQGVGLPRKCWMTLRRREVHRSDSGSRHLRL
jgi:hypothetical protein